MRGDFGQANDLAAGQFGGWSLYVKDGKPNYVYYSPVTKDYDPWDTAFTGTIKKVTIAHKGSQEVAGRI